MLELAWASMLLWACLSFQSRFWLGAKREHPGSYHQRTNQATLILSPCSAAQSSMFTTRDIAAKILRVRQDQGKACMQPDHTTLLGHWILKKCGLQREKHFLNWSTVCTPKSSSWLQIVGWFFPLVFPMCEAVKLHIHFLNCERKVVIELPTHSIAGLIRWDNPHGFCTQALGL